MFQIAFGLGTDSQHAGSVLPFNDLLRSAVSLFDTVVYTLIKYAYMIFFNIASSEIINSQTIKEFYGRVQLILGVIMIFKLSISLLQIIMNPDLMSDQKKGFGKVVSRTLIMLAMFVAIIPLSIPQNEIEDHSYNAFLNQHGLLFGTMYSLQYRLLENNTITKLILGNTLDTQYSSNQAEKEKAQEKNGERLSAYLLKIFISPNKNCSEKTNKYQSRYDKWGKDTVTVNYLIDHVNDECHTSGDNPYVFAYLPVISTLCGLVVLVCFATFCIDIAVRAVKLAALRLIAPIPIISYIDPKSAEQGAFANWVKMLISTYLDLFIRLAIISFVVFLVQGIVSNGLDLPLNNTITGMIATAFVIVGMFYFAKQAPKFIRDALGLKNPMGNIGLGGALAGIGALVTGGSVADAWDASRTARRAQIDAYNQGKAPPPLLSNFTSGRDYMAQNQTGNPKMTYDQMKRGLNFLAREGITNDIAETKKQKMYDLQDEADTLKNINDKINMNGYDSLSQGEKDMLEAEFRRKYGIATGPLSAAQFESMKNSAMDAYLQKKTEAAIAKAEYDMIQKEQQDHGAAPSYKEKYHSRRTTARWSDLTTPEGRRAVTSGGFRQTVRNVAGMTGNSTRAYGDNRRQRTAENVTDRGEETKRSNADIASARAAAEARRRRNRP